MKTIFFTKLVPFLGAMNLTFTVAQGKEDTLIVSILPQPNIKDSSKSNITPLIIKGTADELDEGFFEHIQQPLEKVTGICVNIKDFEANAEKLKKESSADKEIKDKEKKNKEKVKALCKEASAFVESKEFDKAQKKLDAASKLTPDSTDVANVAKSLVRAKAANAQPDMFDIIDKPDVESPHELDNAGARIEHGMSEEHIEVFQEEQDQKWTINQSSKITG